MLLPNERSQAIELLVQQTYNSQLSSYNEQAIKTLLKLGHKGFASYSDLELMRALTSAAKKTNSYEINNFISTIAAEKFILE